MLKGCSLDHLEATVGPGLCVRYPVVEVGDGDGPLVVLCCSLHGDEGDTLAIARQVLVDAAADPPPGTCRVVLGANPLALASRRRTAPHDGRDLNRAFGNDGPGRYARQVADAIRSLAEGADLFVDLHQFETHAPTTGVFWEIGSDEVRSRQRRALAEIAPDVVIVAAPDTDGSYAVYGEAMSARMARDGVPSVMLESSCHLGEDHAQVDAISAGLLRAWRGLTGPDGGPGEAPWPPARLDSPPSPSGDGERAWRGVVVRIRRHVHVECSGIFRSRGSFPLLSPVGQGEEFAQLLPLPPDSPIPVRSPESGVLLQLRCDGYVTPEDYVAVVGVT